MGKLIFPLQVSIISINKNLQGFWFLRASLATQIHRPPPKSLTNLVPGGNRKNSIRVTLSLAPLSCLGSFGLILNFNIKFLSAGLEAVLPLMMSRNSTPQYLVLS